MKTHKKTLATTGLILMAGFFMMIAISSPAQEIRDTADRVERQMGDKLPGQEMLPGDPDQQDRHPDMDRVRLSEEKKSEKSPEKSPGARFTVDSDALINGLTVGRGGGNRGTNTAFGYQALRDNTSGGYNTAIGLGALRDNTTGYVNTASGAWALYSNTTGDHNTATGFMALYSNTIGDHNTANGYLALKDNTLGNFNTASGFATLLYNRANSRSTAMGYGAMAYADNREEGRNTYNTAVGYQALRGSETPGNNIGRYNTAVGDQALYSNTTGDHNTASGFMALYSNTIGDHNTANGYLALYYNTIGDHNTASGYQALQNNTSGNYNAAIGAGALKYNTTGSNNTAVGVSAGNLRQKINQGTFIGRLAWAAASNLTNITGIGYGARPNESNRVRIGNASVTQIGGFANWTNVSDAKYKSNIEENIPGLEFILRLRPVTYNMNVHKLAADLGEDMRQDEDGNMKLAEPSEAVKKARDEKSAIIYSGFIAQEVEKTATGLGYEFSGVDAPKHDDDFYSLRYAEFVVPIVKAIQEQQQQIETLSPEGMGELLGKLDALEADNANLVAEQKALQQANELMITEQEVLRAENEQMRGQIGDILDLLAALGVEIQQCCNNHSHDMNLGSDDQQLQPEDHAQLKQNAPNPFQENTLIRYYLPKGFQKASIIITDLSGNMVKSFSLSGYGHGQILISGGTMKAGTYIYTLISDGHQVESKRMVLL